MRVMRDAWLVMPDGAPIAWLQRRSGVRAAERVAGPELMLEVVDRGRERGIRHFFLGSTSDVLEALVEGLETRFPGIEVAGAQSPGFGAVAELASAAETAAATTPDIVWVAFGAPKQELWMWEHVKALAPAIVVGVGAAFDFHAGTKRRAPRWAQRSGLEWMHRMATEPRRLAPRYLRTNIPFVLGVAARLGTRRGFSKADRAR